MHPSRDTESQIPALLLEEPAAAQSHLKAAEALWLIIGFILSRKKKITSPACFKLKIVTLLHFQLTVPASIFLLSCFDCKSAILQKDSSAFS